MTTMVPDDFPTLRERAPFQAVLPKESNGFLNVVDRNGVSVATCYADASRWATAIAMALNLAFTEVPTTQLSDLAPDGCQPAPVPKPSGPPRESDVF